VDRGFESYDWAPAGNKRLRRADVVVDRTLGWLRTHGREPFFLVVHFFDPHMEYDPPPATRGRFSSALPDNGLPRVTERIRATMRRGEAFDRDYVVALYDEEILFVDRELGRLFRALEGLDALVLLTSDHGEELFDHGEFEHGHSVYNELLRVPLIVRGPSIPPGRHRTPVSLLDVFPTVLATLGLTAPQELPGLSLWPVLRGGSLPDRLLYAERTLWGPERQAIIRWPHKLTRRADTNRIQLFDLEADFAERQDMVAKHSEDAEQLRLLLAASLAAASSAHPGEEVELDGELLDELRALGYVR
jgi:arylsulfatase A-like enzyme